MQVYVEERHMSFFSIGDHYSKKTMALTLLKTSGKIAIGVGAVYVTAEQGLWTSNAQSRSNLERIKTKVLPTTTDYLDQVPSPSEIKNKTVDNWNWGVHKVFGGLASSPDLMADYSKKAADEIKRNLKS